MRRAFRATGGCAARQHRMDYWREFASLIYFVRRSARLRIALARSLACPGHRSGGRDDNVLRIKPPCPIPPPRHPGLDPGSMRRANQAMQVGIVARGWIACTERSLHIEPGYGLLACVASLGSGSAALRALSGMTKCLESNLSAQSHLPRHPGSRISSGTGWSEAQIRGPCGVHSVQQAVVPLANIGSITNRWPFESFLPRTTIWRGRDSGLSAESLPPRGGRTGRRGSCRCNDASTRLGCRRQAVPPSCPPRTTIRGSPSDACPGLRLC